MGHVWILAGRDWSLTSSRGKPLWLCRHTQTPAHTNTIIHRGNKCCFSTFQSVFFTIYILPRATRLFYKQKRPKTNRQIIKQEKSWLPPPWQMCWDFFSTLWRCTQRFIQLSVELFIKLNISITFNMLKQLRLMGAKKKKKKQAYAADNSRAIFLSFPEPAWSLYRKKTH